jgi:hypothetical protein
MFFMAVVLARSAAAGPWKRGNTKFASYFGIAQYNVLLAIRRNRHRSGPAYLGQRFPACYVTFQQPFLEGRNEHLIQ